MIMVRVTLKSGGLGKEIVGEKNGEKTWRPRWESTALLHQAAQKPEGPVDGGHAVSTCTHSNG